MGGLCLSVSLSLSLCLCLSMSVCVGGIKIFQTNCRSSCYVVFWNIISNGEIIFIQCL